MIIINFYISHQILHDFITASTGINDSDWTDCDEEEDLDEEDEDLDGDEGEEEEDLDEEEYLDEEDEDLEGEEDDDDDVVDADDDSDNEDHDDGDDDGEIHVDHLNELDSVAVEHEIIDIKEPLGNLKNKLETKLTIDLTHYNFYLHGT